MYKCIIGLGLGIVPTQLKENKMSELDKVIETGAAVEGRIFPGMHGRKKRNPAMLKIPVCYKLHPWIVEWLRAQELPCSLLIENALMARHKLKSPIIK